MFVTVGCVRCLEWPPKAGAKHRAEGEPGRDRPEAEGHAQNYIIYNRLGAGFLGFDVVVKEGI